MKDQAEQHQNWWQKINQHRMWSAVIVVASVLVIALIVVVVLGYRLNWPWVGVSGGNSKITTTTTATEQPPAKTLWDWMQLLFIPVVLAVAGFWFNHRERKATELRAENERKAAGKRAEVEREIALDNQREAALQGYINKMSELILREHLSESVSNPQVKSIAQVGCMRSKMTKERRQIPPSLVGLRTKQKPIHPERRDTCSIQNPSSIV